MQFKSHLFFYSRPWRLSSHCHTELSETSQLLSSQPRDHRHISLKTLHASYILFLFIDAVHVGFLWTLMLVPIKHLWSVKKVSISLLYHIFSDLETILRACTIVVVEITWIILYYWWAYTAVSSIMGTCVHDLDRCDKAKFDQGLVHVPGMMWSLLGLADKPSINWCAHQHYDHYVGQDYVTVAILRNIGVLHARSLL